MMNAHVSQAQELEALRDRVFLLEEQLGMHEDIPPQLKMRPSCRVLFGMLLKREFVSYEALNLAIYQGNRTNHGNEPNRVNASVTACLLRSALKPHGLSFEVRFAQGWFMTVDQKTAARELIKNIRKAVS